MGKRLDRYCEFGIVDKTAGFGLDFVKKKFNRPWSNTLDMGAILERRTNLRIV